MQVGPPPFVLPLMGGGGVRVSHNAGTDLDGSK
jgi:hypothetical protein